MRFMVFMVSLCCPALCVSASTRGESLVVAAVSCESRIRETEFNLGRIEHWARKAAVAGADLVLFPESGIHAWWQSRENRQFAEPIDGPSFRRLTRLAAELDVILAVGMTELDDGKAYITHALFDGNGVIGTHRKSALAGGDNGEAKIWDIGNDANVFDIGGRKIGIAICFESVHPQTCAALKANGAEIILAPFSNGTDPKEITDPQRKQRTWIWERVKENRIWYVACDATPHDKDGGLLPGAAFVINPDGELVACTPVDGPGEAMVVYTIPARRD
jgi:predicted amidohydrolase